MRTRKLRDALPEELEQNVYNGMKPILGMGFDYLDGYDENREQKYDTVIAYLYLDGLIRLPRIGRQIRLSTYELINLLETKARRRGLHPYCPQKNHLQSLAEERKEALARCEAAKLRPVRRSHLR
jgi:hypothetical protein